MQHFRSPALKSVQSQQLNFECWLYQILANRKSVLMLPFKKGCGQVFGWRWLFWTVTVINAESACMLYKTFTKSIFTKSIFCPYAVPQEEASFWTQQDPRVGAVRHGAHCC